MVALSSMLFFRHLIRDHFLAFVFNSGGFGLLFWITFGSFLGTFHYLGHFLKIVLPCRRELKKQGPGVTTFVQKTNINRPCLWVWFSKPHFVENVSNLSKMTPEWDPNWSSSPPWAVNGFIYFVYLFSPMGQGGCPSGAQWCPKWFKQRVPKGHQNGSKMIPRASKKGPKLFQRGAFF